VYRLCLASFEPKLWKKVIWRCWKPKRKDDFELYWQDEKDWLCIVEFLPPIIQRLGSLLPICKVKLSSRSHFSRGTRGGEFFANHGRDVRAQDLDGTQHLVMRKRGDAHLERDA